MCPAVRGGQGAPTVPSGLGALGTLYLLWGLACPGLEIRGSPSLLSLREGLGTKSKHGDRVCRGSAGHPRGQRARLQEAQEHPCLCGGPDAPTIPGGGSWGHGAVLGAKPGDQALVSALSGQPSAAPPGLSTAFAAHRVLGGPRALSWFRDGPLEAKAAPRRGPVRGRPPQLTNPHRNGRWRRRSCCGK